MRLVDADELLNHVWDADTRCGYVQVVDRGDIEEAPTVVELVRCEDCKYVIKWRSEESAKKFGQVYECARGVLTCPDPNDFCSRGKRKE